MKNIYYVVGSYPHPIGSVDYINALKLFFNKTNIKINIVISTKIIKNQINIFLESFNEEYINYMKEIKNKYPNTKYIIICTEFTEVFENRIVFNCFNEQDFEDEKKLTSSENSLSTKLINNDLVVKSKNNFQRVGRKMIRKFSNKPNDLHDSASNLIQKSIDLNKISDRRKEFHSRSNCLNEIIAYSDFLLAAHPEITNSLSSYVDKPCYDFPFYVDEIDVDIFNKKINGFYMGGTLNEHRQIFVNNLGKSIINMNNQEIYETFIGHSNNPLYRELRKIYFSEILLEIKLKADIEDLSKELNEKIKSQISSQSNEDNTFKILKKVNADFFPESIETLLNEYIIYYQSTSIDLPHLRYELYIPQSKDWPYSSPMRFWHTFMNNAIPITFSKYSDHPLNDLVEIYEEKMSLNIVEYLERVKIYNSSQASLFKSINKKIDEMIKN